MRGRDTRVTGQRARFLESLASTGNVSASAAAVGLSRNTIYILRREDEEFADAFADAIEQATDALEAEARRRALDGVEEPVVSAGRLVVDPQTDKPLMVRRYSDTLMVTLLKAHRPDKFKDRAAVETSGRVVINVTSDDAAL